MDVSLLLPQFQYAIAVGIVLVCALLVYAFGFKNADQPSFAQLSSIADGDRKQATGKKRAGKIKEKRSANAQVAEKASPAKKVSPVKGEPKKSIVKAAEEAEGKLKERKQEENKPTVAKKEKNSQVAAKSGKENKVEQTKNKKNLKNLVLEKPDGFDDGDWEQAYSKKDKRNKKKEEETPSKKSKKNKKTDLINETFAKVKDVEKVEIKDKIAKETENKELKEKNQKDVVLEPLVDNIVPKQNSQQRVEKEELTKVEKVEKPEKEDKKKSKKAKKVSEGENIPPSVSPTSIQEKKPVEKAAKKTEEPKKKQQAEPVIAVTPEESQIKNAPAFDELGDAWTEAKPQKKSKKKARKDN